MPLQRRLHPQMLGRGEVGGGDEGSRQGRIGTVQRAESPDRIVLDGLLPMAAIRLQELALVAQAKIGSTPLDTLPAKSEMVPVGATVVRSALRMPSRRMAARSSAGRVRTWPEAR